MFSKKLVKIQYARGRTARHCHQGLQEACGEAALPYRLVASWARAFRQGRESVLDMPRSGHHQSSLRRPTVARDALDRPPWISQSIVVVDQQRNPLPSRREGWPTPQTIGQTGGMA
ncbi:hypothetical protein ANN_11181 [Periplaneta americana]|uniref:Mos1 transposase HTH domain-containing protein n=1 Tax=Periplaneta americana TaxID=6978 RepID=A0ABQ8T4A0_PERAM|nr:hypothetical protein ANN_11181 [Periplaneta americana]